MARRGRIGIAIPAYNAASTLEATLQSCIRQTFRDWFAIVTVDGQDAAQELEIVERLRDARISVECNGRQLGQHVNFNRGILRCLAEGAEWIKLLSADDLLVDDALERCLALGDRSECVGLVYGYYDIIDENGNTLMAVDLSDTPSCTYSQEQAFEAVARLYNPVGGPSAVMIRANVVERSGLFNAYLDYWGDAAYWHKILHDWGLGVVGERPILGYRAHANSVSGRQGESAERFAQPIDVARELAARYAPFSKQWWMARRLEGIAAAGNVTTALGMLRRGRLRACARGIAVTAVRAGPVVVGASLIAILGTAANRVRGRHPRGADPLAPQSQRRAGRWNDGRFSR